MPIVDASSIDQVPSGMTNTRSANVLAYSVNAPRSLEIPPRVVEATLSPTLRLVLRFGPTWTTSPAKSQPMQVPGFVHHFVSVRREDNGLINVRLQLRRKQRTFPIGWVDGDRLNLNQDLVFARDLDWQILNSIGFILYKAESQSLHAAIYVMVRSLLERRRF